MLMQDLPDPLPAHLHPPVGVIGQIGGELANAPVRERTPELARTCPGRHNDEPLRHHQSQAGTATRTLRVQRGQPPGVEIMNHIPDRVFVRGDQPGDRRNRHPGRRA